MKYTVKIKSDSKSVKTVEAENAIDAIEKVIPAVELGRMKGDDINNVIVDFQSEETNELINMCSLGESKYIVYFFDRELNVSFDRNNYQDSAIVGSSDDEEQRIDQHSESSIKIKRLAADWLYKHSFTNIAIKAEVKCVECLRMKPLQTDAIAVPYIIRIIHHHMPSIDLKLSAINILDAIENAVFPTSSSDDIDFDDLADIRVILDEQYLPYEDFVITPRGKDQYLVVDKYTNHCVEFKQLDYNNTAQVYSLSDDKFDKNSVEAKHLMRNCADWLYQTHRNLVIR